MAKSQDRRIAQRHLLALPARLALMRWTRGGDIPHTPTPNPDVAQRAVWFARLQRDFEAFLAGGGFHRAEPASQEQRGQLLPATVDLPGEFIPK
jgi:hypothetical protein